MNINGCVLASARCVTMSKPYSLSSGEAGINLGIRSWESPYQKKLDARRSFVVSISERSKEYVGLSSTATTSIPERQHLVVDTTCIARGCPWFVGLWRPWVIVYGQNSIWASTTTITRHCLRKLVSNCLLVIPNHLMHVNSPSHDLRSLASNPA
jgi:hypothetical protein